jgi:hypothetical protein
MNENLYHTVYLSYEEGPSARQYVGKHSTMDPYDDYFGSFHDDSFQPIGKYILGIYKTARGATQGEIMWQHVLDVVRDPSYVNRAYQTSKGFDTTGRKRPPSETSPGGKVAGSLPFWNNGIHQKRSLVSPGEGWVPGKLPFTQDHKDRIARTVANLIWWTNGKDETRSLECPGLNWEEGRLQITVNSSLWECTVTGYTTTAGPLSRFQKSQGIDHKDPTNRRRIS